MSLNNIGCCRWILCFCLDQILCFFHPIIFLLRVTKLEIQNKMMLMSKDINDEKFSQNLEEQKKFLMCLKVFKKMELNIETIFQMTGKMILIALVKSETRTNQGLLTIFEEKDYFGIDSKAKSLYWSRTGRCLQYRAIHNWLSLFSLFFVKKIQFFFYKRDFMQLFDILIFKKKIRLFFCPWKHGKTALIFGPIFFFFSVSPIGLRSGVP